MSGLLAVINGGCHNAGLNGAEGKKWGSSVDTRTRMLMQYNLSAFASVYIYIFICYTFNILFIYTNGSFKDHGYTSLKKAVVKSNRQKTHTRHALSYFLGLLGNLIEVRL